MSGTPKTPKTGQEASKEHSPPKHLPPLVRQNSWRRPAEITALKYPRSPTRLPKFAPEPTSLPQSPLKQEPNLQRKGQLPQLNMDLTGANPSRDAVVFGSRAKQQSPQHHNAFRHPQPRRLGAGKNLPPMLPRALAQAPQKDPSNQETPQKKHRS